MYMNKNWQRIALHTSDNKQRTLTFSSDLFLGQDGELFLELADIHRLHVFVLSELYKLALLSEPHLL